VAIEARINEAVNEAKTQGVAQKEVTPFLLRRIVELTDGRSLEANMAQSRTTPCSPRKWPSNCRDFRMAARSAEFSLSAT